MAKPNIKRKFCQKKKNSQKFKYIKNKAVKRFLLQHESKFTFDLSQFKIPSLLKCYPDSEEEISMGKNSLIKESSSGFFFINREKKEEDINSDFKKRSFFDLSMKPDLKFNFSSSLLNTKLFKK